MKFYNNYNNNKNLFPVEAFYIIRLFQQLKLILTIGRLKSDFKKYKANYDI